MRHLESLSTGELAELADGNGLDIPPGLERVFIIGELLELERVSGCGRGFDGETGGEEDVASDEPGEPAALPDRYGTSFVDVLIRDPLWVFVFWEAKRKAGEGDADPGERRLRVVPLGADGLRSNS